MSNLNARHWSGEHSGARPGPTWTAQVIRERSRTQIDPRAAVGRPEVEGEHALFLSPPSYLMRIAHALERLWNARASAEGPQELDGEPPRFGLERRDEIEIEGDARPAVKRCGHASYDDEIRASVTQPDHDVEADECRRTRRRKLLRFVVATTSESTAAGMQDGSVSVWDANEPGSCPRTAG